MIRSIFDWFATQQDSNLDPLIFPTELISNPNNLPSQTPVTSQDDLQGRLFRHAGNYLKQHLPEQYDYIMDFAWDAGDRFIYDELAKTLGYKQDIIGRDGDDWAFGFGLHTHRRTTIARFNTLYPQAARDAELIANTDYTRGNMKSVIFMLRHCHISERRVPECFDALNRHLGLQSAPTLKASF